MATEVVGDNLIMLDKRTDGTGGSHHEGGHSDSAGGHDTAQDSSEESQDLPF